MHFKLFPTVCVVAVVCWLAAASANETVAQNDRRDTIVIDSDRLTAAGIRSVSGRHLTLHTDDRDRRDVEELVAAFDQAVPQWGQRFGIDDSKSTDWHVNAFLMAEPAKFQQAGLIHPGLPEFLAGYALGNNVWIYPQPGNYYTRHLLLHEGTHAYMHHFLGSSGPAWYSEGMAELLGLHRWKDHQLTLGYSVRNRRETDYWGRVKIIRDDLAAKNGMSLEDVLRIEPNSFLKVRSYGWSWAACEFLMRHPVTAKNFGRLQRHVELSPRLFRRKLLQAISESDRDILRQDWNLFIHELDYGYEVAPGILTDARSGSAANNLASFAVASDHSWQRTGIDVKQGDQLELTASGEFEIRPADSSSVAWRCQAGGITIQYYRGRPLGMLLAGVLPTDPAKSAIESINQPLIHPIEIGYGRTINIDRNGQLCLRVNEFPGEMSDNRGTLEVSVKKLK